MKKKFPLGHVLSVTTGRLCAKIEGVYEILNHITGDNVFTHQIPRACRFAGPLVLADHPELSSAGTEAELRRLDDEITKSEIPMDGVRAWLSSLNLPADYEIQSHADAWLKMNPVEELEGMVGKEKIVVVGAPQPENTNSKTHQ